LKMRIVANTKKLARKMNMQIGYSWYNSKF